MSRALAIVSVVLAALVAGGCEAFMPAPTRPPVLDHIAGPGGPVEVIDPSQLAGFPISADVALVLADRRFAGEFAGGETTVLAASVASRTGPRAGWVVVRADPQGEGEDSGASVMVVIDAITGEPIDFSMRRGDGLGNPGRRGVPIPAVPSPAAVDSTP